MLPGSILTSVEVGKVKYRHVRLTLHRVYYSLRLLIASRQAGRIAKSHERENVSKCFLCNKYDLPFVGILEVLAIIFVALFGPSQLLKQIPRFISIFQIKKKHTLSKP